MTRSPLALLALAPIALAHSASARSIEPLTLTVRNYALPAGALRPGVNSIEIDVVDTGGGGGIWGPEARGVVLGDGRTIPFDPGWRAMIGPALSDTGPPPSPAWAGGGGPATLHNGMIAPLGDYSVTGFAWYQGEANGASGWAGSNSLSSSWRHSGR